VALPGVESGYGCKGSGLLAVGVAVVSSLALAQEQQAGATVDSEHIFGFTEGADIGDKGESELEASPSDVWASRAISRF